ncbi:hypothetical protein [Paraferrimonas haliotis]|uniref:Uncharacterized protein n=1 Tax=Paraferrimonas haliotis TaxID=2013866 RepID=A0AA37TSA4_9GAMM|nr:hypothetical protein [Paraferrimonas haliotis]GLS84818.1 hypothetical protein GCM10007894_27950 [Paraferrimonas haliotis]
MLLPARVIQGLGDVKDAVESEVRRLNTGQKLYLTALLLLLVALFSKSENSETWIHLASLFGIAAVLIDVWPMIVRLWDHLLGKGVILLFNAGIAHLAIGFAGQEINAIVGVEPNYLFHVLVITTLVMAPTWILLFTSLAMTIYLFALNCLLLLLAGLRLLRIRIHHFEKREAYPILTTVTRIIVVPAMLYSIVMALVTYGVNISVGSSDDDFHVSYSKDWRPAVVADAAGSADALPLKKEPSLPAQTTDVPKKPPLLHHVIAFLTYELETYANSHCKHDSGERIRFVGINEILVAKKDKQQPLGYDFSVRLCEFVETNVAPKS